MVMPNVGSARTASGLATRLALYGQPFARSAANRALIGRNRSRIIPTAGRFTRRDVTGFVSDAFERFEHKTSSLPVEPTVGSRQNVALAALTLCLLEALEAAGIERGYAIELTGDTCWRFYRHWGRFTKTASGVVSRDPTRRLRLSVNAFLTYPFGRPGYRFDDVAEADGRSLDMLRCPVADYLGRADAADLCTGSWCNLDYALAEMWDGHLQRSTTLVTGGSCCDFRFHASPVSVDLSRNRQTGPSARSHFQTRPMVRRSESANPSNLR